jgi:hypothetical protein
LIMEAVTIELRFKKMEPSKQRAIGEIFKLLKQTNGVIICGTIHGGHSHVNSSCFREA